MKLQAILLLLLGLHVSVGLHANSTDSLIKQLDKANDFQKVELYNLIGYEYFNRYSLDTALIWFEKMQDLAEETEDLEQLDMAVYSIASVYMYQNKYKESIEFFQKSLNLNIELENDTNVATNYNNIGVIYQSWSKLDLAIECYEKAAVIYEEVGQKDFSSTCYNNIGAIFDSWGRYEKALNYYNKALEINKKLNDLNSTASTINNIGSVYYAWGKYDEALNYFNDALALTKKSGDKVTLAVCYNNLGTIYTLLEQYDLALEYLNKTRELDIELKREDKLAVVLSNIGNIFKATGEYDKAINYYKQALELDEKLGREDKVAIRLSNLASIYTIQNKTALALNAYYRSVEINQRLSLEPQLVVNYKSLYQIYKTSKNYEKALYYHELHNELNDSLFTKESNDKLNELQTIYETEKKEQQLELEIAKNEKNKEQLERKRIQNILYIVGLSLMGLMVLVGLYSYRKIRKSNILIAEKNTNLERANKEINEQKHQIEEKNEELYQQNEEISAQRDEIESQRDILQEQKTQIEIIHKDMTSSIRYAERIQSALLVIDDVLIKNVSDHFILFKPRDIVSGDFYFVTKIHEYLIVATADCTGHGVPGAFMSMMGTAFLSEIVNKKDVEKSSQVLEELRNKIVKALHQNDSNKQEEHQSYESSVKDGMDISLVTINTKTNVCQFSGANLPLYIVRSTSQDNENLVDISLNGFDLLEIKSDRMPIAIYEKMEAFTNNEIQLKQGDALYLFSDGFADQFGGATEEGEKFKYKPFKKLFLEIADKSMTEQKEILDKVFMHWSNNGLNNQKMHNDEQIGSLIAKVKNGAFKPGNKSFEQVDDVCIVGLKL